MQSAAGASTIGWHDWRHLWAYYPNSDMTYKAVSHPYSQSLHYRATWRWLEEGGGGGGGGGGGWTIIRTKSSTNFLPFHIECGNEKPTENRASSHVEHVPWWCASSFLAWASWKDSVWKHSNGPPSVLIGWYDSSVCCVAALLYNSTAQI